MGYSTWFNGEWSVTPALKPEHLAYLKAFATTRRMMRDEAKAEKLPDPLRLAVGLPIGFEGAYYVGGAGDDFGQTKDGSVVNYNEPPGSAHIPYPQFPGKNATEAEHVRHRQELTSWYALSETAKQQALAMGIAQPGLWCQWVPNDDGTVIEHDGREKFYEYTAWIEYLIHHFLGPWGYKLNGDVYWDGEESDDKGLIEIKDNVVKVKHAVITYK